MKTLKASILLCMICFVLVGCGTDKNDSTKLAGNENVKEYINKTDTVASLDTDLNSPEEPEVDEPSVTSGFANDNTDSLSLPNLKEHHDSSTITIGDMTITYPLSWDALKEIFDAYNVNYEDLEKSINHQIEHVKKGKVQTSERVYLDEEDNSLHIFLGYIDNTIYIRRIDVNMANAIDQDKYPVKFDGYLDINCTVEEAIQLYGEPDIINENKSYIWGPNDNRKIRIMVTTGFDPSNKENISMLTVADPSLN